ncbi:cytochrome b5 [Piptocephalis cylindrospora]|uniref:Cytochrome b5 n=1 Tax=Piptocephalis cylindrospora TaxID=1907219 RepID=A0A4P9Y3Q9_9FUNG|nr:cytochrome b5 [Piptocephalis cylindrospora]|eukprot:RKP13282.1 cytochrome b5 [Piptocephalis cylindrospora]
MTSAIPAAELAGHTERSTGLWMAIHGKVYDVTNFIEEHPGGEDILFEQGGTDATEAFEDVGHSEEARASLMEYLVGPLEGDARDNIKKNILPNSDKHTSVKTNGSSARFVVIVSALAGFLLYKYLA